MVKKAKMPKNTNIHTRIRSLFLLILFVFLDAIRIFTDTFFGFWRNVDTANTTVLVRGNMCLRFGTLGHVLDFLLHG